MRGRVWGIRAAARVAAYSVVAVLVFVPTASAARAPTVAERIAIDQEIASYFWRRLHIEVTLIRNIRVTRIVRLRKSDSGYVDAAVAHVQATERGVPQQAVIVLLARYQAAVSRWEILDYGGAEVGCQIPMATLSHQNFRVLRELGLRCP